MSALRAQHWLSLVTAMVALCAPISSAHAQQRLPPFFGIVSGIINSAIADSARREWRSRSVADYNCLDSHNLSADQLAANGIGPNAPGIRRLLYECAHARTSPRIEPKPVTTLTVGPYHPNFAVDGLALGGAVNPDSAAYKAYACRPSVGFGGFTWCSTHHDAMGKFGPYTSWVTILYSDANKVAFITQVIKPAFFQAGDVDREIQRLSRGFGQAQVLNADPRPGVPHTVLPAWGAVTLSPLDEDAMDALRRGEEIHRGLIAEFIGDAHKSARIGLPVYSIGGGPGYLWGASFDDAGKGSLRISAVDASALATQQIPTLPPPSQPAPPAPQPVPQPVPAPLPPPSPDALGYGPTAADVRNAGASCEAVVKTFSLIRLPNDVIVAHVACNPGAKSVYLRDDGHGWALREQNPGSTPLPPEQPQPAPQLPPAAPVVKTMDVIDFLVDWKSLIGQTVTVSNCTIESADISVVRCSAGRQGLFHIDSDTLAREDLRRALRECAGFEAGNECRADVTGNVTEDSFGEVKLKDASMKWAATPAAPLSPPASPPVAENETSEAMPAKEKAVIDAVEQARHDYASASNEMQEGAARPARAKSICAAIPDRQARQWVGNVSEVSSNSEGKGVLNIEIASGVQVKTWNNALSDSFYHTLIDPSSNLYRQALTLSVGQAVRFSGQFVSSSVDCIEELSLTLHGSVSEPDFIIRFSDVSPLAHSDSACSAVPDPNERLTCFYKTTVSSVEPSAEPVTPSARSPLTR